MFGWGGQRVRRGGGRRARRGGGRRVKRGVVGAKSEERDGRSMR
jgi:hypothetical protein